MSRPKRAAPAAGQAERDKPWLIRTYSGHSTAAKSNELYRKNLAKGQTGLSIAFDLPTQTGYDSDHELARGEVGKVGVPVSHLGDMRTLLAGIPLGEMNTSMTINATAAWLLALYVAVADEQGTPSAAAHRHHPERHHQGIPLARHLRVSARAVAAADQGHHHLHLPRRCRSGIRPTCAPTTCRRRERRRCRSWRSRWPPRRPCSTPSRHPARWRRKSSAPVVGRISFFVNAGLRFITEICKMRAFTELWDEITAKRYGVTDPKHRLFRYGVQVNSLGLTEQQPENNVYRILLEMLAVTLSKRRARARRAAAGLERGARPAAAVGPAVVDPHAADPRLRDRPAGVRRHLRGLQGDRAQGRRAQEPRPGRS